MPCRGADPECVGRTPADIRALAAGAGRRTIQPDGACSDALCPWPQRGACWIPAPLRLLSSLPASRATAPRSEQAASCQRVLGGAANLCYEYATKRYRSNCINWGMLPFTVQAEFLGQVGDFIDIPNIRQAVLQGQEELPALLLHDGKVMDITLDPGRPGQDRAGDYIRRLPDELVCRRQKVGVHGKATDDSHRRDGRR